MLVLIGFVFGAPPVWSQDAGNPPQAQTPQFQEAPRQFKQTCSLCHGADGRGTDRAPTMVNSASLRNLSDNDIATIIQKGKAKMPAFPLPASDIETLVRYIRSMNVTASSVSVPGDPKAGELIFFGSGQCSSCHVAAGRGSFNGPDLSNVARRLRLTDMGQSITNPGVRIPAGYESVVVELNDGSKLQGFARAQQRGPTPDVEPQPCGDGQSGLETRDRRQPTGVPVRYRPSAVSRAARASPGSYRVVVISTGGAVPSAAASIRVRASRTASRRAQLAGERIPAVRWRDGLCLGVLEARPDNRPRSTTWK